MRDTFLWMTPYQPEFTLRHRRFRCAQKKNDIKYSYTAHPEKIQGRKKLLRAVHFDQHRPNMQYLVLPVHSKGMEKSRLTKQ